MSLVKIPLQVSSHNHHTLYFLAIMHRVISIATYNIIPVVCFGIVILCGVLLPHNITVPCSALLMWLWPVLMALAVSHTPQLVRVSAWTVASCRMEAVPRTRPAILSNRNESCNPLLDSCYNSTCQQSSGNIESLAL